MDTVRLKRVALAALCLSTLSACGLSNNGYFVKADSSPGTLAGVAELAQLPPATPSVNLGVTFKSDGKVLPEASEALYKSFCAGLKEKGRWQVHRIGRAGDDFAAQIAAVKPSALDAVAMKHAAVPQQPRLLVLVENHPDKSAATAVSYFFSGMSYGTGRVHKPTDRYDVTIAYHDADGIDRIYRGHQDLIFATGSKLFSRDPSPGPGYKRFDSSLAAFNGIVDNSVNGSRRGKVTVGSAHQEPVKTNSAAAANPDAAPAISTKSTSGSKLSDAGPRERSGIQMINTD